MAKKELTPEEITQIAIDLQNSKSEKRRSAAKKIGKHHLVQLGDELYNAYLIERKDTRTWETQVEMIKALGKIKFIQAIKQMAEVIQNPNSDSATTTAATIAYIRLKRCDNNDVKPIIDLISKNPSRSVIDGSLSILAFDDIKPPKEQINVILNFVKKMEEYLDNSYIKGTTDPRIHVLSASTNWDQNNPELQEFINNASQNPRCNQYMDRILKGKKVPYGE